MTGETTDSSDGSLLIDLPGPTRNCQVGETEASVKAASPRSGSSDSESLDGAEASRTIERRVGPRFQTGDSLGDPEDHVGRCLVLISDFVPGGIMRRLICSENRAAGSPLISLVDAMSSSAITSVPGREPISQKRPQSFVAERVRTQELRLLGSTLLGVTCQWYSRCEAAFGQTARRACHR